MRGRRDRRGPPDASAGATDLLYGLNPVVEALRAGRRRVHEVYVVTGGRSPRRQLVDELASGMSVPVRDVDGPWMSRRFPAREDQGVAALVDAYPYVPVGDLLRPGPSPALLLALDQVQDPRNLGAAARSAVAFGAGGLVIHKDRSALVTPAAVKASAGMTEHLAVACPVNLARALEAARRASIWIRGLDASAPLALFDEDLRQPTLLVVGGEGSGLRRLTADLCDSLVSIPMDGRCSSLNAATVAALALGEAVRQRRNPA